jgi:serine/threonine protein kinase
MDFLRMMILLLNDLKKIHTANILHRDIKCDNIMFYEKKKELFFIFIYFGSSFDLSNNESEKIKTYSLNYSPAEQNTPKESFASKYIYFNFL